jgi:hypothetical protein
MTLGLSRPRNGGIEWQNSFLAIELHRHQLAYRITPGTGIHKAQRKLLWLTGSNGELTLPFVQSYCILEHIERGRWHAVSEWDGRVMAHGCSITDVVGKVIRATYGKPTPWAVTDFPEATPDPLWWS